MSETKPAGPDPLAALQKFEETVAACNRCGFCTSYCPTYNATGKEIHSPRGRNQAVRAIIEGKLTDPESVREAVDSCLLCGECTSVCFSEVPTADLMLQARAFLRSASGLPWLVRLLLTQLLPYPNRLARILKLSFWSKNLRLSTAARKLGLGRVAPVLAAADELVERLPWRFLLDHPATRAFQERHVLKDKHRQVLEAQKKGGASVAAIADRPKVALLTVCGSQYLRPAIGLATIALLNRLKVDFMIPEIACCGLPAASLGAAPESRRMAEANIAKIERGHFESVLIDDSSCAAHFREYPRTLSADGAWTRRAHDVSLKFRDLTQFFVQKGLKDHLARTRWTGGPVAYHDPCKAQYAQNITQPPRDLLNAIPGLQLTPVADADQCCGGGGSYSFTHPDMSRAVLEAKVANIISSGCRIVVTSSASCLIQLAFGLRRKGSSVEVLHLTEFLERALSRGR